MAAGARFLFWVLPRGAAAAFRPPMEPDPPDPGPTGGRAFSREFSREFGNG